MQAQTIYRREKAKFNQEVAGLVPNGIDFAKYNATEKKINRNKKILMQYHILEKKGIDIGLDALRIIKQRHPEVEIQLFGVYKPQHAFPNGTNYYFDPPQTQLVELYHTADIFILPSLQEGFSLPPMEAMAAKCAVIATNVGAVPDYSIPGETAIIIPPGDKEALVYELEKILKEKKKIKKKKKRANQHIQNFTWEKSSRELERILTS